MKKKFFFIVGEASGDVLGAKMMAEIKAKVDGAQFVGVGGNLMKKEGLKSLFDMNELAVMGIFEVIPHIFKILGRIKQVTAEILRQKPDYVITIDSPDFCFRVMKKLEKCSDFKKIHVVAPSVWAYREGRARKIAKLYDLLLTLLPFEPPYFTKYGLKTQFIGHPIVEKRPSFAKKRQISSNFRKKHGFYEKDRIIYITPGSRISEVSRIFADFVAGVNLLKNKVENLAVVIAVTDKTKDLVKEMAKELQVKYVVIDKAKKDEALLSSNVALAKSGTNTVENSLYKLPMVIGYKLNFLTYILAKILVKIRFANLVNLILNEEVIPELLQYDCNGKKIAYELQKLFKNPDLAQKQIEKSEEALKIMGMGRRKISTHRAVEEVLKL